MNEHIVHHSKTQLKTTHTGEKYKSPKRVVLSRVLLYARSLFYLIYVFYLLLFVEIWKYHYNESPDGWRPWSTLRLTECHIVGCD